jgi:hypothetical protein
MWIFFAAWGFVLFSFSFFLKFFIVDALFRPWREREREERDREEKTERQRETDCIEAERDRLRDRHRERLRDRHREREERCPEVGRVRRG